MAGFYPDPLGHRVPYDIDGTVGVKFDYITQVPTYLSAAHLAALNDEDVGYTYDSTNKCSALLFPAAMDLKGLFLHSAQGAGTQTITIEVSPNSTNGVDGYWHSAFSSFPNSGTPRPFYREAAYIQTFGASPDFQDVRAVRVWNYAYGLKNLHVYSDIVDASFPDRLRFWHPTGDYEVPYAYFDWGNTPRGSTEDITFRVKNDSASLTATTVSLYLEGATEPAPPTIVSMHSLSDDATNFSPNVVVSSLAPGAISSVITLRRTMPSNAALSTWTVRVLADVDTWS